MQQYYATDTHHILTAFHTADGSVSLDVEHVGTVQIHETDKLEQLHSGEIEELEISNDRTPDSATLSCSEDGELIIELEGRSYRNEAEVTLTLTSEQFDTLIESLGEGDDSVGYEVEGVSLDGVRDRS